MENHQTLGRGSNRDPDFLENFNSFTTVGFVDTNFADITTSLNKQIAIFGVNLGGRFLRI